MLQVGMKSMVRKYMVNRYLLNPEEYFTPEVMQALDEIAQKDLVMVHEEYKDIKNRNRCI